jgi:hypothetical protein
MRIKIKYKLSIITIFAWVIVVILLLFPQSQSINDVVVILPPKSVCPKFSQGRSRVGAHKKGGHTGPPLRTMPNNFVRNVRDATLEVISKPIFFVILDGVKDRKSLKMGDSSFCSE